MTINRSAVYASLLAFAAAAATTGTEIQAEPNATNIVLPKDVKFGSPSASVMIWPQASVTTTGSCN